MSRKRTVTILLSGLLAGLLLLCGVLTFALADGDSDGSVDAPVVSVEPQVAPTPVTSPAPKRPAPPFAPVLSVKTLSKQCFGSAGCNVQYKIVVALTQRPAENCDVTYEVRGLDDAQTATLTVQPDGTYSQDAMQFGQTPRSSSKLTARVVDVECG